MKSRLARWLRRLADRLEPHALPLYEIDIDAVHRTRTAKTGQRPKRDAFGRFARAKKGTR